MDGERLESMIKPWWLSPSAFQFTMILAAVVVLGYVGMCWYIDGLLLEWVRTGL